MKDEYRRQRAAKHPAGQRVIKLSAEDSELFKRVMESEERRFREKCRARHGAERSHLLRPRCGHAATDQHGKLHPGLAGGGDSGWYSPRADLRHEENRAHHEKGKAEPLQPCATSGLGRCHGRVRRISGGQPQ
jgi:hypothetical protein